MAMEAIKKEKLKAIIYTVSSVVLSLVLLFTLFQTYQELVSQRKQIQSITEQAQQVQTETLAFNQEIKNTREQAIQFIPSNFEEFFQPDISNSQLTRMFDQLENRYQSTGENFLIRSISYSAPTTTEESQTSSIRVNLSLTTSQNNLLSFLRDIEKTSLSSDEAFYFLDPQSLSFSNLSPNSTSNELNVDLQVNILLNKNNG